MKSPMASQKDNSNIRRQSGAILVASVLGIGLSFLVNLMAARSIGSAQLGQFAFILSCLTLVSVCAKLGLDLGVVYYIPKLNADGEPETANRLIRHVLLVCVALSSGIAILIVAAREQLASIVLGRPELATYLAALAPLLVYLTISHIARGIFRGLRRPALYSVGESVVGPVTRLAALSLCVLAGFSFFPLAVAYYASFLLVAGFFFVQLWRGGVWATPAGQGRFLLFGAMCYSVPLMFSNVIVIVGSRIDILMANQFVSDDRLGVLHVVLMIANVASLPVVALNSALAPHISNYYKSGRIGELLLLYKTVTKWTLTLSLLIVAILGLTGRHVLGLFGSEFMVGYEALVILMLGHLVTCAVGPTGILLVMTNNTVAELVLTVFSVTGRIVLLMLLIPKFGITGAAMGSAAAIGATNLTRLLVIWTRLGIHPSSSDYRQPLVALAVALAAGVLVRNCVAFHGLLLVGAVSAITAAAFAATILLQSLSNDGDGVTWDSLRATVGREVGRIWH